MSLLCVLTHDTHPVAPAHWGAGSAANSRSAAGLLPGRACRQRGSFATYAAAVAMGAWHANGARVALHMVAKFVRLPNVALVT